MKRQLTIILTFAILSILAVASVHAQERRLALPGANGPYGGVDNLGRVLSLDGAKVPAPRKDRYIGLFYFSWLAQHGKTGPYDITKIVAEHPEAIKDAKHPAWGPMSLFHHWGESIFGYYTSDDAWVKRKHVQMLTDAGVDFLIIDATNASAYLGQVLPLMAILEEYRLQGWNVPKIVFYTNSHSGATIQGIYDGLYAKKLYPELWFTWEGKPLIVGHPEECSEEVREFFRIKKSQWPNENKFHDDGFPWIAFERPQHVFKNAKGENEVINVSVSSHNGTVRFSSSAFYGDQTNWTRSFHDGKNDPAEDAYKYGYNFAEQFEYAKKQDPKIIFLTGWNEWIAMRFDFGLPNEPVCFVDLCDTNNSRDMEPMLGGYGDNYYMQMVEFIRQYKGNVTLKSGNGEYRDYVNDTVDRDEPGYGELHYTNKTGRNDFDAMKVSSDAENLYFHVRTVKPIALPLEKHAMSLFLRTRLAEKPFQLDKTAKNWEGYQFVINRIAAPNDTTAILESSEGGWNWKERARVSMKIEENQMQLTIPKKALGLDAKAVYLEFKWADNYQGEGDINSFYLDGDAAPLGRLNYVYEL